MPVCPPDAHFREFGANGMSIQTRCWMTQQRMGAEQVAPTEGQSAKEPGREQLWHIRLWSRAGITPMLQLAQAILKDPEDPTQCFLLFANQVGLPSSVPGVHCYMAWAQRCTNGPGAALARDAPHTAGDVLLP